MDKRTTKRRLLKLAEFLETKVPRKHFDMGSWISREAYRPGECGTTACAIGHAAFMPYFQKLGLRLDSLGCPVIKRVRKDGMDAVRHLFGVDLSAANYLFGGFECDKHGILFSPATARNETPKQVAKRIRKFVADMQP